MDLDQDLLLLATPASTIARCQLLTKSPDIVLTSKLLNSTFESRQ